MMVRSPSRRAIRWLSAGGRGLLMSAVTLSILLIRAPALSSGAEVARASGPDGSRTGPDGSMSGPIRVPVYHLIYGATPTDVLPIAARVMAHLTRGSRYHGDGAPYLTFETVAVAVAQQASVPAQPGSGAADYAAIYDDGGAGDLCAWAQARQHAQIWVWENGSGGAMQETVDNGPLWQNLHGTNAPDCGVQVATFSHNYERAVAFAVESHIHRYEQFFSRRYTYAFNKESDIPYHPPASSCPGSDPNDFWGWCVEDFVAGFYGVAKASPMGYTGGAWDSDDVAQCGWAHYPPNITWAYRQAQGDASRYTYNYTGTVRSTCATWRLDQDPTLTAEVISCTAWGCDRPGNDNQAEFFVWWMQNVPGPGNTNYDEAGQPMDNWWAALFP